MRLEGRGAGAAQRAPVDAAEEGVPLDLLGTLLTEPLLTVTQQRADEALGVRREPG